MNGELAELKEVNAHLSERDLLHLEKDKVTLVFMKGLNDAVAAQARQSGYAAPTQIFGSHYGLARPNIYLDMRLLQDPAELSRQMHHELEERRQVIQALITTQRIAKESDLARPRSAPLEKEIKGIVREIHWEIKSDEVLQQIKKDHARGVGGQLISIRKVLGLSRGDLGRALGRPSLTQALKRWENEMDLPSIEEGARLHRFFAGQFNVDGLPLATALYSVLNGRTAKEQENYQALMHYLVGYTHSLLKNDPKNLADDLIAETFKKAYEAIVLSRALLTQPGRFPGQKRTDFQGGDAKIETYLTAILRNLVIDKLRKNPRQPDELSSDLEKFLISSAPSPEKILIDKENRDRLVAALYKLPSIYFLTMLIFFWEPFSSYETLCAMVDRIMTPPEDLAAGKHAFAITAFKSQLSRGKNDLRDLFLEGPTSIIEKYSFNELPIGNPQELFDLLSFISQEKQPELRKTILAAPGGKELLNHLRQRGASPALSRAA